MSKTSPCEPLKLYLSAPDLTVVAVLIKEDKSDQRPIYYTSHILKEAETRLNIEKLVYILVMASKKLRQYFQGRLIMIMANQPLRRVLPEPGMLGKLASWTIELSQFHIEFQSRTAMISRTLVDFVSECTFSKNRTTRNNLRHRL
ncbi:hypothetical protein AgCh_039811 [Apium graveolens]